MSGIKLNHTWLTSPKVPQLLFHWDILYRRLSDSAIQLPVMPHCVPEKLKNSWASQVLESGVCAYIRPAVGGYSEVEVNQKWSQQQPIISVGFLLRLRRSLDPKNELLSRARASQLGSRESLHSWWDGGTLGIVFLLCNDLSGWERLLCSQEKDTPVNERCFKS